MRRNLVIAMTGASGAIYGVRLLEVLLAAGCDIYLSISAAAQTVLQHELDLKVDLERFDISQLFPARAEGQAAAKAHIPTTATDVRAQSGEPSDGLAQADQSTHVRAEKPAQLRYCHYLDLAAPIASGSLLTDAMVICPCSCGTLGAIVHGASVNLIHRAAEVHLKERRRLILVPRETPLSLIHLENMHRAAAAGATVLPAMPGFYHRPKTVEDLVDFVVSRICDQLGVANELIGRWG